MPGENVFSYQGLYKEGATPLQDLSVSIVYKVPLLL